MPGCCHSQCGIYHDPRWSQIFTERSPMDLPSDQELLDFSLVLLGLWMDSGPADVDHLQRCGNFHRLSRGTNSWMGALKSMVKNGEIYG